MHLCDYHVTWSAVAKVQKSMYSFSKLVDKFSEFGNGIRVVICALLRKLGNLTSYSHNVASGRSCCL